VTNTHDSLAPRLRWLAFAALLQASLTAGCTTRYALVDAVVPNPLVKVRIERYEPRAPTWIGTYGKEPQYRLILPDSYAPRVHIHLDRQGWLDVPPSLAGCVPLVFREPAKPSVLEERGYAGLVSAEEANASYPLRPPPEVDGCAYVIVQDTSEPRRILLLDLDGRRIHEQLLPLDRPYLDPRRLGLVVLSPLRDVGEVAVLAMCVVVVTPFLALGALFGG